MRFDEKQVATTTQWLKQSYKQRLEKIELRRRQLNEKLAEAAQVLRREFGATRVLLIGSLDAPWFSETSDVDIVVEGLDRRLAFQAEKRVLQIMAAPVDLLFLEELDPEFQKSVLQEGREIT